MEELGERADTGVLCTIEITMEQQHTYTDLRIEHRGYLIFPRAGGAPGMFEAFGYTVRNEKGLEVFTADKLKGEFATHQAALDAAVAAARVRIDKRLDEPLED